MNFNELYDISLTISPELVVWPGDPAIEFTKTDQIAKGATANVTRLSLGTHVGTHVDAPLHFLEGAAGVDEMNLQALVGTVYVLDFTHLQNHIAAVDLEKADLPPTAERVLFKTRNSAIWQSDRHNFHTDYIALAESGADWLLQRAIKLVGIDYLSIEKFEPAQPVVHQKLLRRSVVILEGLNLGQIEPGEYTLLALPLKVQQGDGAPVRALLGR